MLYSIKDLERISGIKAHTLRMWEKRYDLLTPERSDANIRAYGDDDVRKLLNVKTLLDGGWKISHVGELGMEELQAEVKKAFDSKESGAMDFAPYIHALTAAMLDINEREFDRVFTAATTRFGLKETMMQVINPFLQKVGLMWTVWELHPGHEHFASNVIRRKLFGAIDQLMPMAPKPERFLLFLPEGESHEIGLLFANYWLRSQGFEVVYLGQNVPFDSLSEVAGIKRPDKLLTFFIANRPVEATNEYLHHLSAQFGQQAIFIAGDIHLLEQLKSFPNVKCLFRPEDLSQII